MKYKLFENVKLKSATVNELQEVMDFQNKVIGEMDNKEFLILDLDGYLLRFNN